MTYKRFVFEGDVHDTLACVPLSVRRKLDLVGLKISLAGWQALPREERLALCHLPVEEGWELSVYREVFQRFAERANVPLSPLAHDQTERARWNTPRPPPPVQERLDALGCVLPPETWAGLEEEGRYALVKMAEPKRDPRKFGWVLQELGLLPPAANEPAPGARG
ncbi:nitrate reductase associated protein [Pendulispora albinea]|uniref:Nitrate reductase associated protein n=1 Tax=Pendulispora albinea TaxID=2741071 RepID=A0ABZ2M1V5_9BACT